MTAHLVKGKDKTPDRWICDCGSKLEALYNTLNKYKCEDKDLACAWCFRKRKIISAQQ